jgi:lipopolysaccharide export LptBFGC system permease protein LptF
MQLKIMIFISLFVFCLILLFDFAEMTRKLPISNLEESIFTIKLSFLRAPSTFCEIMHYIYFVTAVFCLWHLCRSHQITVIKSIGHSPQQILYPFISCALFVAAIWLLICHPIGLICEELYNQDILNNSSIKETNNDIWISFQNNDQIIFIKSIGKEKIDGLCVFDTKNNNRTFANQVIIKDNTWLLNGVVVISDDKIKNVDAMEIVGFFSPDLVRLLLKTPRKQNIYHLYKIYEIQRKDRVLLKLYELELHKLLANCMNFIIFALISAVICFPINRYKTRTSIAVQVILISIFVRFVNNILESLIYGDVISIPIACWSMGFILGCISIAILIWKEA